MNILLKLAFLFFIGSLSGWGIEVVYRRFFSGANPERRWINPGFLTGPYLPLYGFSLCVLYLLAGCEQFLPIGEPGLRKAALFVVMSLCVTAVEYLAGLIFIEHLHIKLWDYSQEWGNVKGIICPKFTFFWLLLSAGYYFFVHPRILGALDWLARNLAFSFIIGVFFGVFAIDFAMSARLMSRIRRFAKNNGITVQLEELKAHIRASKEAMQEKRKFLLALYSRTPLSKHLTEYLEKRRDALQDRRETEEKGA